MSRTIIKSRFPKISNELRAALDPAAHNAAVDIAHEASRRVNVRTGRLKAAIHVERTGVAQYEVRAGNDEAWYGHLLEWGTTHSAAYPFLTPAAEQEREPFERLIRHVLERL